MTSPASIPPGTRGVGRVFFEGAARGELLVPRCRDCGVASWPPRPHCIACGSSAMEWMQASGRGVVHTFTVVRQAPDPSFAAQLPYVVAMIDLDEGVRLMSRFDGAIDAVRIGLRVTVVFVQRDDGAVVPMFRPTA